MKSTTFIVLTLMALVALTGIGVVSAANLGNDKTFLGSAQMEKEQVMPYAVNDLLNYTGTVSLGNSTGAKTAIDLAGYSNLVTCQARVVNASGVGITNTATYKLQGSNDNSFWFDIQTEAITASEVSLFTNSASHYFRYLRANITAIQNANSSYVKARCVSFGERDD